MTPHLPNQPSPLTGWGVFSGRRRSSDSPYIENIWEGVAIRSGIHMTAADGVIDLTLQRRHGVTRLIACGPTSKARLTQFDAGDEVLTIRLRTGVHMAWLKSATAADSDKILANVGGKNIFLCNHTIPLPDFNTAEEFVKRLAMANILERDIVVEEALDERPARTGQRAIQRHFITATGLTMSRIRQIRRAERARDLLATDSALTAIAYETGYSNQGHMTHAFKYFFGMPPSVLRTLMNQ